MASFGFDGELLFIPGMSAGHNGMQNGNSRHASSLTALQDIRLAFVKTGGNHLVWCLKCC